MLARVQINHQILCAHRHFGHPLSRDRTGVDHRRIDRTLPAHAGAGSSSSPRSCKVSRISFLVILP